jgi:lipopolysaccharide transport system ATP-binding protein
MSKEKTIKKSNGVFPTKTKDVLYNMIKECDKILKKSPDDLEALRRKGIYLHELCFYNPEYIENALICFNKILQINDKDKEMLKRKAGLLTRKETIEEAIIQFDKILEIDPNDVEALCGKGIALQINGKPYLANQYFDKALKIDSNNAIAWKQKGSALSARGETWDEAIECYDKAISINVNDYTVWQDKGTVLHKKGRLDEAIECYDKSLSINPKNCEVMTKKGFALSGKFQFKDAIEWFDASLSIKNNELEALKGKADAVFFLERIKDALEIYESILELNPRYGDVWRQKGYCQLNLGQKQEAVNSFTKAVEINADDYDSIKEKKNLNKEGIISSDFKDEILLPDKDESYAIEVNSISKSFKIQHEKFETLFSLATNIFSKKRFEILPVLNDISFKIRKGEMLGIIGKNGSGKTTLLKILAGILNPDKGSVKINGTIAPLLQLGTGFQGELTAKENIILSGLLLGFSKKEMLKRMNKIIEFAEIEKFADTKIKNFSSGMYARLAFSISIQINPDILLIDEILAVGDINFVKKSYNEFLKFREMGKTIIFVSHSLDHIKNLCDRAVLLNSGKIEIIGNPQKVIEYYTNTNRS